MSPEQFAALKRGDLVRHKHGAKAYVVCASYGDRITAVHTVDLTNPSEWDIVQDDGAVIAAVATPPAGVSREEVAQELEGYVSRRRSWASPTGMMSIPQPVIERIIAALHTLPGRSERGEG